MAIKHAFTSPKTDGVDTTLVRPVDWNADHIGRISSTKDVLQERERLAEAASPAME